MKCLIQIPIASHRKYSRTFPNCVLANFQVHLNENVLGQLQIVSLQIPIASHRKHSKTIPNCVLAKCQMHLIQNFLRHIQIVF